MWQSKSGDFHLWGRLRLLVIKICYGRHTDGSLRSFYVLLSFFFGYTLQKSSRIGIFFPTPTSHLVSRTKEECGFYKFSVLLKACCYNIRIPTTWVQSIFTLQNGIKLIGCKSLCFFPTDFHWVMEHGISSSIFLFISC